MRRDNPTFVCDACGLERPGYPYEDEFGGQKEGVPLGWIIVVEAGVVVAAGPPKKIKRKHACSSECVARLATEAAAWASRTEASEAS